MSIRRVVLKFVQQNQSCSYALLTSKWKQMSYPPECLRTIHISCTTNSSKRKPRKDAECDVFDVISHVIPPHEPEYCKRVSLDDWRSNCDSFRDAKMFRSILQELGRRKLYDAGKSYIEMIKKFEPHLLTPFNEIYILRFFVHCSEKFRYFTDEEDIRYIYDTYRKIRKMFPVLEYFSAETLVLAMQKTSQWRVSLELLDDLSLFTKPKAIVYSSTICNALRENDIHLAWNMIDKMKKLYLCPHDECWTQWLQHCRQFQILEWKDGIGRMLEEFYCNHIQMSCAVADEVMKFINELCPNHSAERSSIHQSRCSECSTKLHTKFSKADHDALKEMVEKIITHDSLYASTTPVEIEKFRTFIENCSPYDVVIDGLNALYSRRGLTIENFANLKHQLNLRLLFLGRVHLAKRKDFRCIASLCQVFLCENLSRDDVYILYSAIYHRPDVKFLSDDKMRSQQHYLIEDDRRNLFFRWQHLNQAVLGRHVRFNTFLPEIHKSEDGTYHIPCVAQSSTDLTWTPAEAQYWLCIRQGPKNTSTKRSTKPISTGAELSLFQQNPTPEDSVSASVVDELIKRLEESSQFSSPDASKSTDEDVESDLTRAKPIRGLIKGFQKKYRLQKRVSPNTNSTWLSESHNNGRYDEKDIVSNLKLRFKQMQELKVKKEDNNLKNLPTVENER